MSFFRNFLPSGVRLEPVRALYIHVPFCSRRCAYCDFFSNPLARAGEFETSYMEALAREAGRVAADLPLAFETVYIGGGTPTALGDDHFRDLLRIASTLAPDAAEFSVEANPESLSAAKLEMLAAAGATRLSLGIQSMDAGTLRLLGRAGTAEINDAALELALDSGLDVSADLIVGVPRSPAGPFADGEAVAESERILRDVRYLCEKGVGHISLYDLTIEEETPLGRKVAEGCLLPPDPDSLQDAREAAEKLLFKAGFGRYEVSSYAKPGKECAHNGLYWSMASYLGLGAGAVSTFHAQRESLEGFDPRRVVAWRIGEVKSLAVYVAHAAERAGTTGDGGADVEPLSAFDVAFEMVMLGLRTKRGVDLREFERRFGLSLAGSAGQTLARHASRLHIDNERLAVGPAGFDTLNPILVELLGEMERTGWKTGLPEKVPGKASEEASIHMSERVEPR